MIELENVTKIFRRDGAQDVIAVDDVSFQVGHGETLSLIGTSGSGKSTTVQLVNRTLCPSSGEIRVQGKSVAEWDPIRLRRSMGYVIQSGGLLPHMTVGRNVGLLCELEGWSRERTHARVRELLELVNLPPDEFLHRHPKELSGGQRQRVGVARALALDPPCVLMDEPFGALDPITRQQLHREFRQLLARVEKSILLITHDMSEAFAFGDRVALMDRGRLVQMGTETDFRERPANRFVKEFLQHHFPAPSSDHAIDPEPRS